MVLCYGRAPDFHSAVIAHSSFQVVCFVLGGGGGCGGGGETTRVLPLSEN